MATEIERRFLVDREKLPTDLKGGRLCKQKYLSFSPAVRVRVDSSSGKGFLTVKGPGTLERPEFEYEVPVDDAKEMQKLCRGEIWKVRYDVLYGEKKWEVDFFLDLRGLIIAEIELKDKDEQFKKPVWIGREITYEPDMSNAFLAKLLAEEKESGNPHVLPLR